MFIIIVPAVTNCSTECNQPMRDDIISTVSNVVISTAIQCVNYKCYDNMIFLFLSCAANLSTTSSMESFCESSFSIDITAKSAKRCSDIVERKNVFVRFKQENYLSHSAVLTTTVRAICNSFTKTGNASCSCTISKRTSLMVVISLSFRIRLAIAHSMDKESLFNL